MNFCPIAFRRNPQDSILHMPVRVSSISLVRCAVLYVFGDGAKYKFLSCSTLGVGLVRFYSVLALYSSQACYNMSTLSLSVRNVEKLAIRPSIELCLILA